MWTPQMLRTHIGKKLKTHIESIGKANTIKMGWGVAKWLACSKFLVICPKSPQPLSHIHICPEPKVKLGTTDLIYPAPPSSLDIATARNPNQFDLTNGISVSPRWASKLSVTCYNYFGPTEFAWLTPYFAYYQNWSHRVCVIGQTELRFYPP